jgi:hypothetical protein
MSSIKWYIDEKKSQQNNPSYTQYVLRDEQTTIEQQLFSPEGLKFISQTITRSLKGVDPQGRDIVVGNNVIKSVLSSVIQNYTPQTGDIYSKYQVMYNNPRNDLQDIVYQTIQIITEQIRDESEMVKCNNKLNIWDAKLYGEFNPHGLLAHPPIKIRNKRPDPMLFHMRY